MEDLEIVGLYWARDQLAIAESQRKYGSLCGGIAMNILRNREDAEECVNDTWGRAWDNIPPQRPGSLGAYLGRIVRNLALNRMRKNEGAAAASCCCPSCGSACRRRGRGCFAQRSSSRR